jgi:hypothetical protein
MVKITDIHLSVLSGKLWTTPRSGKESNRLQIADHTVTVRSATVKFIWMMGYRAGRHSRRGTAKQSSNRTPRMLRAADGADLFDLPGVLLAED